VVVNLGYWRVSIWVDPACFVTHFFLEISNGGRKYGAANIFWEGKLTGPAQPPALSAA
jgi:hypothetical protein